MGGAAAAAEDVAYSAACERRYPHGDGRQEGAGDESLGLGPERVDDLEADRREEERMRDDSNLREAIDQGFEEREEEIC